MNFYEPCVIRTVIKLRAEIEIRYPGPPVGRVIRYIDGPGGEWVDSELVGHILAGNSNRVFCEPLKFRNTHELGKGVLLSLIKREKEERSGKEFLFRLGYEAPDKGYDFRHFYRHARLNNRNPGRGKLDFVLGDFIHFPMPLPTLNAQPIPALFAVKPPTSFVDIQVYRAQLLEWSAGLLGDIAEYFSDYRNAYENGIVIPEPTLASEDLREQDAIEGLLALAERIKEKTDPIIDGMLEALDQIVANRPPVVDISSIVDLAVDAIEAELDPNNPISIYAFRTTVSTYITGILLDTAFDLLAADTTDITNTVNAYITRAKSELDDQMIISERRDLNELATRGVLDSEIAATTITRANAKKGRLYIEIENKAEELRQTLKNDAYERAFKRTDARIRAMSLLPLELPPGIIGLLGDVIARQYLDPNAFIGNLPNILATAAGGFGDTARLLQQMRTVAYQGEISELGGYTDALRMIADNISRVMDATGKMATMEAS